MMKKIFMLCIAMSFSHFHAQEESNTNPELTKKENIELKGNSRFTFGLGHTHIAEGKKDEKAKWLIIPSLSFNYDYWVSNRLALGVQSDVLIESFVIENDKEETIERQYPIAVVPVAIYKLNEKFSALGGVGVEFSKGPDLALTRLGLEYGWELPKNWELGAALVWDSKWNHYNSWGIAITISKIAKKRR